MREGSEPMLPIHRPQRVRYAVLMVAVLIAVAGAAGFSGESRADTATPGAIATPMAEATVDDVTIRLIHWEQTDSFTAEVEIVNNSLDAIGVPAPLMQFEAKLPDGSSVVRALRSSTPPTCSLGPGATGRMTLVFDAVEGQVPMSLVIGISEPYRTGAHVVFPLDSITGPSAFGGNAIAGAPATPASPEALSSPAATSAYECTV